MSDLHTTRRAFIASLAATACAGRIHRAQAAAPPRTPLSAPPEALRPSYDVVVVGSGYGGAVMAARLAPGRRLCVLERGREWLPQDFPASLSSVLSEFRHAERPLGLFDYRAGETVDVLTGSGLGGTSLINANVVIAADRDAFVRWPEAIRQDVASGVMAMHENRVRSMLAIDHIREADELRKHWFHRSTTLDRQHSAVAVQARALDLAVNLSRYAEQPNAQGVVQALCTHCGDCVSGCRVGAKNTLDVNYLPLARSAGAEIFTRMEVEWLERLIEGRWRVHYARHGDTGTIVRGYIEAANVILAAGALGSTEILLRSRARGLALSPALGTRFSMNGDLLGLAYNTAVQTNISGFGTAPPPWGERRVGPSITLSADYRGGRALAERHLIEEGAVPSALVDALRLALPPLAGTNPEFLASQRVLRDLLSRRTDGALNHGMVYLGIGHDSASGRIELDSNGSAVVIWPNAMQEPFVARLRNEMAAHAEVFGGRFVDSPRSSPIFGGAMTTVHPLGGCPMAESVAEGVVNSDCEVFDPGAGSQGAYAGLRIVDGSITPASVGVNPLLTIAAIAERTASRFQG